MDSMDVIIVLIFIVLIVVSFVIRYFFNKGFNTLGDLLHNKVVEREQEINDGYSAPIRLAERYPDLAESAIDHGICPKPLGGHEAVAPDSTFEADPVNTVKEADPVNTVKMVTVSKGNHCPACGFPYRVGHSFCANCGASLKND